MRRLSRGSIRAIAATSASVIVSIINVIVLPLLDKSKDNALKTIAVILSVASLGVLFALIDWAILRMWISKFKGEWFYTSESASIDPNGHVGVAKFFIRGGEIRYSVQLYSVADATALANGDKKIGAVAKGSAVSEVVLFNGEDNIKILYNFDPLEGAGGLGVLNLTGVQDGHAMTGKWVMARPNNKGPGEGTQKWFRRKEFLEYRWQNRPKSTKSKKA